MPAAATATVGGQRDVDGLLDQHPLLVLGLEHGLTGGDGLVDRTTGLTDALTGLLAGLRGQRADLAVGQRQRRAVAGVVDAHLLEGVQVGRGGDRLEGGVPGRLDLLRLERGHLDGVVIGVRARHGGTFPAVDEQPGQSRKAWRRGANRSPS